MDLSKAFDTTDHNHLIAKLNAYGFSGDSLKFILSYFKNRKRRTVIENSYNFRKEITEGVLQGFYLDPLFYNIFIMDLLVFSKTWDIANYIDDNNLYATGDCFWVYYWEVFCWLNFFSALFHEKAVTFLPLSSQKSWYSFDWPQKDERLSRPWSHLVILNMEPLGWESSTLTTRPLLHQHYIILNLKERYFVCLGKNSESTGDLILFWFINIFTFEFFLEIWC